MSIDRGRTAVYAAEIAAFEGTSYEAIAPFDELHTLASSIASTAWWTAGSIELRPARRDAGSSTTRQWGSSRPVIRLAAPQQTQATLIHELAHVLAGVAEGHGPMFRRAHVDLVGFAFGSDEATWLLDAYFAMELRPGSRTWPAPPIRRAAGGPLAL